MRVLSLYALLAGYAFAQTLPANWRIQPAGTQVALDSLPLSAAISPDGKFLLALNAGNKPSISVVETGAMKETARASRAGSASGARPVGGPGAGTGSRGPKGKGIVGARPYRPRTPRLAREVRS